MSNSSSKFVPRVQQQTANLIKAIERIHEEENEALIVRTENISRENDRLRKELYDLQQRVGILTERLGFDNLDRVEESLDESLVNIVQEYKAAVARVDVLAAELAGVNAQLALEQASRMEEQQLLESFKLELTRKRQSNLDAQAESDSNREALGRLKLELQAEWQKTSKLESTVSSLRRENESISLECEILKSTAARDRTHRSSIAPETPLRVPIGLDVIATDSTSPENVPHTSAFVNNTNLPLEAQFTHLRSQYDELLASKNRLSEKYSRDLAEWRLFKESYRNTSGGKGLLMSEGGIKTRRRVSRQAKDSPTPASRTANIRLAQLDVPDDDVSVKEEENSLGPGDMPPIQRLQLNAVHTTPDNRQNISPASDTDTQESQTVPTSGQLTPSANQNLPPHVVATLKQPSRPAITAIKQCSQSDDEGNILLRRQYNLVAPLVRSHSSPAESPHHRKKSSTNNKSLGKRKAFVFDGEEDSPEEQPYTPMVDNPSKQRLEQKHDLESREERDARLRALRRKSGPQVLADYQQYKGHGRYAAGPSKPADKTINSEYEINPARNDGIAFEFDSVVRDKNERRRLNASDCIACKEYYEAVGPMPERTRGLLWRSPSPNGSHSSKPHTCKHHHGTATDALGDTAEKEVNVSAHKQAISRHRHKWAPASTPPAYWNIGFPDTQQVEDINRRAIELHEQKRNAIEQEAVRDGGRYRKRG